MNSFLNTKKSRVSSRKVRFSVVAPDSLQKGLIVRGSEHPGCWHKQAKRATVPSLDAHT